MNGQLAKPEQNQHNMWIDTLNLYHLTTLCYNRLFVALDGHEAYQVEIESQRLVKELLQIQHKHRTNIRRGNTALVEDMCYSILNTTDSW